QDTFLPIKKNIAVARRRIHEVFCSIFANEDEGKSPQYRTDHLDFLKEMRGKRRVFQFESIVDDARALIIYQGNNLEEVTAWAKADPYVKLGARGCEIHEWHMQTDYTIT